MIFKCPRCGYEKELEDMSSNCPECSELSPHFNVEYDIERVSETFSKESISKRNKSIWRYLELLPLKYNENLMKIHVGNTSLSKSARISKVLNIKGLFLKDETGNPSGSFKDRGAIIIAGKASEKAVKKLTVASSGNLGAAVARYCALMGIECIAIVPDDTSDEKLVQMAGYGAKVVKVKGIYNAARKLCREASEKLGIPSASWEYKPISLEGWKTTGFEIVEQLEWNPPDMIVVPTGGGSHLLGIWKGLKELEKLGFIESSVKMVAVQSLGCAPYLEAYEKGYEKIKPFKNPSTIAKGLRSSNPFSGEFALKAIRESKGMVVGVSDQEIIEASKLLASTTGIFAEPSGAAGIAGVKKLIEEGKVQNDDRVVTVITGSGLKDTKSLATFLEQAYWIKPKIEELEKIV